MKNIPARQLLITLVPALVILAAIAAASILFHVSIKDMTNDVSEIMDIHPLSGFLSNLGILLWTATASVCFFAAMTLRARESREMFWFLLFSAMLSAYLMLDDLFRIHEFLAFLYLGVKEKFVVGGVGLAVCAYLISFRSVILRTNYGVFILAMGFLTISAGVDMTPARWFGEHGEWVNFYEEGAKWLGIACWCSYYVRTSYQILISHHPQHIDDI
jgi:hypothetical protein